MAAADKYQTVTLAQLRSIPALPDPKEGEPEHFEAIRRTLRVLSGVKGGHKLSVPGVIASMIPAKNAAAVEPTKTDGKTDGTAKP